MGTMFEQGLHADLTLECGEESFPAHRCILASASPVFKAMFKNDMSEQINSKVKIKDVSAAAFRCFLRFFCTGKISEEEIKEQALEILPVCLLYQVQELAKLSSEILSKEVTVENCLQLLEFAWLHDESLLRKCKEFILHHWVEVEVTKAFEEFAARPNHSLLLELVRMRDKIREVRVSFSPFLDISPSADWNSTLKISSNDTVAEVAAATIKLAKISMTPELVVIISKIVDHRIVKIYDPHEKLDHEEGEDHLLVTLERASLLNYGWKKKVVSFAHAVVTGIPTRRDQSQIFYFGVPSFRIVDLDEPGTMNQLKGRCYELDSREDRDGFELLRRSNTDTYSPHLQYLYDSCKVPLGEHEFIAIVQSRFRVLPPHSQGRWTY